MAIDIATIGYEKCTLAEFVACLQAEGIQLLVDVREVPQSRRPGFSKRQLAASLDEAGIRYLHLKALGTPKVGRLAARSGKIAEMHRIYEVHLAEPEPQAELDHVAELARHDRICLMCLEADHARCHRALICDALAPRGFAARPLTPAA